MQDGGVWSRAGPYPCACCAEGKVPLIPWARRWESPISKELNVICGINHGAKEVWAVSGSAPRWLLKQGQVPNREKGGRFSHLTGTLLQGLDLVVKEGKKNPHDDDGVGISIFDF